MTLYNNSKLHTFIFNGVFKHVDSFVCWSFDPNNCTDSDDLDAAGVAAEKAASMPILYHCNIHDFSGSTSLRDSIKWHEWIV